MTKKRSTKRALLLSALSLLMCVSMLVGSTFAWFTDSVVSGSNVIKSGNLDIDVQYTLDGENWKGLNGANDLFQKGLWEPGHTEVVALKIENKGSLALKYVANMNIINEVIGKNKDGGDIVLSEILTVGTLVQGVNQFGDIAVALAFKNENMYKGTTSFKAANILKENQELLPGDAHYMIIKVDMAETVGNEANHDGKNVPSVEFGVNVLATQFTYEKDTFGPNYDKDAAYPEVTVVYDAASLKEAMNNGAKEIYANGVVVEGTTQLNSGATIIGATFKDDTTAVTQTINGTFKDCTFEGSEALRWCYTKAGETVVFENCVIKTDFRGVHFDGMHGDVIFRNCEINGFNAIGGDGTVTFENCTFGNDGSSYNGLNMYSNINLVDCTFNYVSGKTNFIDMEGTGKTLTITNCKAFLDGTETDIVDFVGGSKLAQNTVIYK